MTKPNDIPQDVWDDAMRLHGELGYDEVVLNRGSISEIMEACNADAELIARAIMEAKEEEREECARQVETGQGWITDYLIGGKSFSPLIAAAIRNRKLANNTNKD